MSSNKIIPDISGTAFVVNVSRSEKVMLSKDIYAHHWITNEARELYRQLGQNVYKHDDTFISARHRYFFEKQKEFIRTHDNPVIINIGSGFTNYPYLLEGKFSYIEVDLPNIIEFKKDAIWKFRREGFIPDREVFYYPLDLKNETDREYLKTKLSGIPNKDTRTMIIMEGLTFFLDKETLDNLFDLFSSVQNEGSEIVFDYWKPDALDFPVLKKLKSYIESNFGYTNQNYFLFDKDYIETKKGYVISETKQIHEIETKYAGTKILEEKENLIPANLCALVKL